MKRPILIAVIGYLIGIIWGIYNKSIFPYFFTIIAIILICSKYLNSKKRFKLISLKRYLRYLKLYINKKTLILILFLSLISNSIVLYNNNKYEEVYKTQGEIKFTGVIISSKIEKDYYNVFIVKSKNKRFYINVDKKKEYDYGDKILIKGEYLRPEKQRNYKGFDYSKYLKSKNIYGIIKVKDVELLEKSKCFYLVKGINKLRIIIKNKIDKNWNEESKSLLIGMILGDTDDIDKETIEDFRNSNISHILAISGMHISYIIIGVNIVTKRIFGYRKSNYFSILIIVFYLLMVGICPSISRASIMAIITILSKLLYRKSDTLSNISLSALILLVYNPYIIFDLGFQFSYLGTLGITLFSKNIFNMLKSIKNKRKKSILNNKLGKAISVVLSAQILLFPISILNNGTIGIYIIFINLLASMIIAPILILGIIYIIFLFFNIGISNFISFILRILIQMLLFISNISKLPMGKFYISSPSLLEILIYFLFIFFIQIRFLIYKEAIPQNQTIKRIRNIVALIKYKLLIKKKIIKFLLVIVIIICCIYKNIPKNLNINFVDVGQGDCTFIVTPKNKTILIDGGGQINSNYDVGKSILLPYILNRGYNQIDYIIISHFDYDHIGGILTIMEELKVGKVIICKQAEISENYQKFIEIVKNKGINVVLVNKSDQIKIENNIGINIIWPNSKNLINENPLNNNSIVCKLVYKEFSMLFTGDIEEIAEQQILEEYKNNLSILNSTILKVGHHGSKSSSSKKFIEAVSPKIALIGVGKNNKFGHPNEEVLERINKKRIKTFRTDQCGEISITVNNKGTIKKITPHIFKI